MKEFERSALLLGDDAIEKLNNKKVCVFGIGGVGGYVVEALARTGVGYFGLVDNDIVSVTNINRQIIATQDTIGKLKVDVMKERILSININAKVDTYDIFVNSDNIGSVPLDKYDYIVDAVDTVSAKILIIENAKKYGVKVMSSMGAGNKLNPCGFKVSDISKTKVCPLAKVMRHELKKRNIENVKVVYSEEEPQNVNATIKGSVAFVPSVAGLVIASEVVKDLLLC